LIFYQVWNGYVNLTEMWNNVEPKKLFVSEIKKPDQDTFISSPAFVFKVYFGNHCFTKNLYFQPS